MTTELQRALACLDEFVDRGLSDLLSVDDVAAAKSALALVRSALCGDGAPVAWGYRSGTGALWDIGPSELRPEHLVVRQQAMAYAGPWSIVPLYSAPPRSAAVTDEQVERAARAIYLRRPMKPGTSIGWQDADEALKTSVRTMARSALTAAAKE